MPEYRILEKQYPKSPSQYFAQEGQGEFWTNISDAKSSYKKAADVITGKLNKGGSKEVIHEYKGAGPQQLLG